MYPSNFLRATVVARPCTSTLAAGAGVAAYALVCGCCDAQLSHAGELGSMLSCRVSLPRQPCAERTNTWSRSAALTGSCSEPHSLVLGRLTDIGKLLTQPEDELIKVERHRPDAVRSAQSRCEERDAHTDGDDAQEMC